MPMSQKHALKSPPPSCKCIRDHIENFRGEPERPIFHYCETSESSEDDASEDEDELNSFFASCDPITLLPKPANRMSSIDATLQSAKETADRAAHYQKIEVLQDHFEEEFYKLYPQFASKPKRINKKRSSYPRTNNRYKSPEYKPQPRESRKRKKDNTTLYDQFQEEFYAFYNKRSTYHD